MMLIKMLFIITLSVLAVISDLYSYKVSNKITYSFAVIGLLYSLLSLGIKGLFFALAGMVLPLMILFPLYIMRMLGAGDIKLFCALGSFVGSKLILASIAHSFIIGAIIAAVIMIMRRNALQRLKYFLAYIKTCFLCKAIMPYCDISNRNDGTKMHFTVPIFLGTALVLVMNFQANAGGVI